jgi:cytochrome c-type biogenesis protein CcmH/NrfF
MRRIAAIAAALSLLVAAAPADAAEPKTTLPDVADEVMCTVCGVLLDEAPDSPQAQHERDFIARLIDQGKTKDEIKDALVAEYGTTVLAEPGTSGFDLAAWLVPGIALLMAGAAVAIGLRRWRRATEAVAQIEPQGTVKPLDPDERERLDSDLARYDL